MKRLFLVFMVIVALGLFSGLALSQQQEQQKETQQETMQETQQEKQQEMKRQMQERMHEQKREHMKKQGSEEDWICPWCGRRVGMKSEMQQKYGHMPKGMMHEGHGKMHKGQMQVTSKDQVEMLLEHHVTKNPNLKIGQITEKEDVFEAEIVTKDGSLVKKMIVDKNTGWVKKEY